jgi:aminomethyltransferase
VADAAQAPPRATPLDSLSRAIGARMVPFAGHWLPMQFADGIMAEHRWCRSSAALFDVSHMGQIALHGPGADAALEALTPADIAGLGQGRQRYALLMNADGGVDDDLMVARVGETLRLVVNGAVRDADLATIRAAMPPDVAVEPTFDRALLALQGPKAVDALARHAPPVAAMRFMDAIETPVAGAPALVTRSGYTGEDGFEVALDATDAPRVAEALLAEPEVKPAGLGARDSLRLEAGLCLYGQDLDPGVSPVEAALAWSIGKARRPGGTRAGGYRGAARVGRELAEGAARMRIGLAPAGRAPVRAGAALYAARAGGEAIGVVTSGGFGPTLERPIAMGYAAHALSAPGTPLFAEVRGQRLELAVAPLPFVPPGFRR